MVEAGGGVGWEEEVSGGSGVLKGVLYFGVLVCVGAARGLG